MFTADYLKSKVTRKHIEVDRDGVDKAEYSIVKETRKYKITITNMNGVLDVFIKAGTEQMLSSVLSRFGIYRSGYLVNKAPAHMITVTILDKEAYFRVSDKHIDWILEQSDVRLKKEATEKQKQTIQKMLSRKHTLED